uniref:Uncharacterized protein n=1 Tax=Cucumis melo TaxID=3656 RepID=A0A9I9EEP7_CUCME
MGFTLSLGLRDGSLEGGKLAECVETTPHSCNSTKECGSEGHPPLNLKPSSPIVPYVKPIILVVDTVNSHSMNKMIFRSFDVSKDCLGLQSRLTLELSLGRKPVSSKELQSSGGSLLAFGRILFTHFRSKKFPSPQVKTTHLFIEFPGGLLWT